MFARVADMCLDSHGCCSRFVKTECEGAGDFFLHTMVLRAFALLIFVLHARALELSAVSFGGTSDDEGLGITSVGSNSVAVTGYFSSGTATFGDVVLSSKDSDDVFMAMVSVCNASFRDQLKGVYS